MTPNDPSAQTQAGSPAVFGNSEALLPAKGVSDNTSACKALTAPDMNGSLGVTPNDPCIHASARCAGRLTWGLGQTGLLAAAEPSIKVCEALLPASQVIDSRARSSTARWTGREVSHPTIHPSGPVLVHKSAPGSRCGADVSRRCESWKSLEKNGTWRVLAGTQA